MSQAIYRIYDTAERAGQAARELTTNRFSRFDDVHVVSAPQGGGAQASVDGIVASLMKALVLKSHAKMLAPGIQQGGSAVVVHAPFGTATAAMEILDRHGPLPSLVPDATDRPPMWDDISPMSSLLNMPVLLPDSATFSRFWNIRPLSRSGRTTSSAFGLPEVSRSRGPFAGTFPMALLSSKGTILSSLLGLPLLLRSAPRARR